MSENLTAKHMHTPMYACTYIGCILCANINFFFLWQNVDCTNWPSKIQPAILWCCCFLKLLLLSGCGKKCGEFIRPFVPWDPTSCRNLLPTENCHFSKNLHFSTNAATFIIRYLANTLLQS